MFVTMLLKTLPMAGPSRARITITTTATRTRINAYSTRPCPFSFGANNIVPHLLPRRELLGRIAGKGECDLASTVFSLAWTPRRRPYRWLANGMALEWGAPQCPRAGWRIHCAVDMKKPKGCAPRAPSPFTGIRDNGPRRPVLPRPG